MKSKKVLAMHDLSGVGRCALTVIIPALSAMGVQVCPVPTAVLSTHLGFSNPTLEDLTHTMEPALAHYQRENFQFDAVYTGFLSSKEQGEICKKYIDAFPDALAIIDPVMGDDGSVYHGVGDDLQDTMRSLVNHADIITPNPTEAAILLKQEYSPMLSVDQAKETLYQLGKLGPKEVVLKGIQLEEGVLTNFLYKKESEEFWQIDTKRIPVYYPGTGDLFASILTGSLMKGKITEQGVAYATRFLDYVIGRSFTSGNDPVFGVELETSLPWLMEEKGELEIQQL